MRWTTGDHSNICAKLADVTGERAYRAAQKARIEQWLVAEASHMLHRQVLGKPLEVRLRAYAVSAMLDTMLLHWRDVPGPVQRATLQATVEISGRLRVKPEDNIAAKGTAPW